MVKNWPANVGDTGVSGLIPGLGRSPGIADDNPLPVFLPGNPKNRGAWLATVHEVTQN